jgi:RNA polymerase sigma factor (sigma-70 family)
MTTGLSKVIGHLRQALAPPDRGPSDGQLLERFVADHDEGAFTALVRRHGPMVLGVARRVLRHTQDAEDVFQATFLVLARRAGSVVKRESVGSFLYGTAYRIALEARCLNARRARERQVEQLPHPAVAAEEPQDWRPLLDEELSRLPEKYRAAVVLCELEGRPRREAARQLGVPEGTLSSRLAAARRMLAGRLARRGLALAGGAFGTQAVVPAALAASTVRAATLFAAGQATGATAAAALTEGVCKAMFMSKLQSVVAASLLTAVVGVGAWTCGAGGQEPAPKPAADARDDKETAALREENARLLRELKKAQERLAALEERLAADTLNRRAVEERRQREAVEEREAARRAEALLKKADEAKTERDRLLEARREFERALLADQKGAEKQKLLDEAQAQLLEAQARLKALQDRVVALQDELARARGRQDDPAAAAEAALKEFRSAKDKEAQRHAADALEKALKKLKEQLK